MTTQEREQLKSYIELCSSLEKHSFFVGTDKLVITVPQNPSQKSKLGGYEEESLTSFLVPFRKTYMNDETTFFHSIGNIISRRKVKLRPVIKELKTRYSEALKKAKAISSDPKIDIVDAFINGKYFHTGEESKKDVIKDEYDLKKQAFLLALFDLTNITLELASVAKMALSTKPIPKNPQKKLRDLNKLNASKKSSEIGFVLSKTQKSLGENVEIDDFEKSRLYLFSSALLYEKRLKSEILDNHEIHLIYSYKEKINTSFPEAWLIFRTLISDISDLKTGWFWLPRLKSKFALEFITGSMLSDDSELVKSGALFLMGKFWNKNYIDRLKTLATDEAKNIRSSVVEIIRKNISKDYLPIINILLQDSDADIQKSAFELQVDLFIKTNPTKAIELMNQKDIPDSYYFVNLEFLLKKQNKAELTKLSTTMIKSLRILAIKELISRNHISGTALEKLLDDSQWEVRYYALEKLLSLDKKYTVSVIEAILDREKSLVFKGNYGYKFYKLDADDLIGKVYETKNFPELQELLDWSINKGTKTYETLGVRFFNEWKKTLYFDLKDNFKTRKKVLLEKSSKNSNMTVEKLEEIYGKYDDLMINHFKLSALKALLKNGNKNAVQIAKDLLTTDHYQLRKACLLLIAKYGSQKDAEYLFNMALKKDINHQDVALIGALNLDTKNKYKIIEQALDSEEANVIETTLGFAFKNKKSVSKTKIINLLNSKNSSVRDGALAYIDSKFTEKEKKEILEKEYKKSHYYYNIICWLDRVLYAPAKLKSFYKAELHKKLGIREYSLENLDDKEFGRFVRRYPRVRRYS